jgi:hypothetical protein
MCFDRPSYRCRRGFEPTCHERAGSTKSPGAILDDAQRRARRACGHDGRSNPTLSASIKGHFVTILTGGAVGRSYGLDATAGGDFGESAVRATIAPEMNSATAPARSNAEVRGDFIEQSSQR